VNPVEGLVAAVVVNDNPPNAEFKSPRALWDGTGGALTTGVLTAGVTGPEGADFGAYNRKILFLRSFRDVATGAAAAAGTTAAAEFVVSAELKRVRTGDVKSSPNKD
jgi:hypothetical protein